MVTVKLTTLEFLDRILFMFQDNQHLDFEDIQKALWEERVRRNDLREALQELISTNYIYNLPESYEDATGEWFKNKQYGLTFTGRIFLESTGGYKKLQTTQSMEKNRLLHLQRQQFWLTVSVAVSSAVSAIYYVFQLYHS